MMSHAEPSASATETGHPLLVGSPYRFVRKLGQGGMGEVLLVEHRELGRPFVAKVIHASLGRDPELVDRMRVEAQALARLNHPNIVSATDFRTAPDGRPFFVMEQLRGRTLGEELGRRQLLLVNEAVTFARQLLAGLGAAHAIGIVHRDVKPANMFLHEEPDRPRVVKLLDFGLAKVLPNASTRGPRPLAFPTAPRMLMGTPRYVSPEVALGKPVDARSDLYSAGLVLYVMLSGRGPFDHVTGDLKLVSAHALAEPLPPSRHAPEPVPPELDQAVLKALRKNPDERFQSASEFEQALAVVADMLARPTGWLVTTVFEPPRAPEAPADAQSVAVGHGSEPLAAPPADGSAVESSQAAVARIGPWLILLRVSVLLAIAVVSALIGAHVVLAAAAWLYAP
jgi:eukaryotic-like serine/threonine-protein kinase